DGGWPGLRAGHAGAEAPRAARRHRWRYRLPGIGQCPVDHRRYHPRGWRFEALSFEALSFSRATCTIDRREFNDHKSSETLSFVLVSEFAPRPHVPGGEGTDGP